MFDGEEKRRRDIHYIIYIIYKCGAEGRSAEKRFPENITIFCARYLQYGAICSTIYKVKR